MKFENIPLDALKSTKLYTWKNITDESIVRVLSLHQKKRGSKNFQSGDRKVRILVDSWIIS